MCGCDVCEIPSVRIPIDLPGSGRWVGGRDEGKKVSVFLDLVTRVISNVLGGQPTDRTAPRPQLRW